MVFSAGTRVTRRLFCLFVCASLYFLTVDVLADTRVLGLFGEAAIIPTHLMYLLCQCAGFLLFYGLDQVMCKKALSARPLIAMFVLSGACLMVFLLASNAVLVVAAIDVCLLSSGTIGAFAYYRTAIALNESTTSGKFCGFGIAAAAVLQILVIALPLPELGRAALLLLALCAVSVCVLTDDAYPNVYEPHATPAMLKPDVERTSTQILGIRQLAILLAIVAVISFVGGLNDGVLTRMNAASQIDLYAAPRLFYLVAAVIAGFVADYRDGRYLSLLVLAAMLCSTVGLLFMDSPLTMFANACIYSLLAGFSIVFFTVPFMRLAVRTSKPALWAGMGRALRLPFLALGTAMMEFTLGRLPFNVTVGVSTALCVVLLVLFFAGGFLSGSSPVYATVDAAHGTTADCDALATFATIHELTSREQEILVLLYQGSTTAEIASELFISEKTVRNHISNMMAKAGVSSRTELVVHALKGAGA